MIIDTALSLFLERGYDATKMEDVAEVAGIGTSTLYRYFATKDLLIIEPLMFRGTFAAGLRARPADEPLELALGHAVADLLLVPQPDAERRRRIREVVDSNPAPRMRLLEEFVIERDLLEQAIAERLGRTGRDLFSYLTACATFALLEYIGRLTFTGDEPADGRPDVHMIAAMIQQAAAQPPALPTLTDEMLTGN